MLLGGWDNIASGGTVCQLLQWTGINFFESL